MPVLSIPTCVTPAALSQSRSASSSRLTVRNVRTSLRARRADQQTGDHRFLVHIEPAAPLDECLHPRLPSSEGDRDAAGRVETLPQMLPVPGATKNSASMQRGPDCLSGSQATQNVSASTRSPIQGSDKPTRAATIFINNSARPAQLGCLAQRRELGRNNQHVLLLDELAAGVGRPGAGGARLVAD